MLNEDKTAASCARVLRLFGADTAAVRRLLQCEPGVEAQCASRGAETLAALRAADEPSLARAEKALRTAFPNDLYGSGEEGLAAAAVAALEANERLLACADSAALALLEPRLEAVEGAARVFDFGAMSCADEAAKAKIERQAARKATEKSPAAQALARVQATVRVVGAELAAGCLTQKDGTLLFVGTQKGCYVRTAAPNENAALWLLDMVRRAAAGLEPAAGTRWQRYGAKLCLSGPDAPHKKGHALRALLLCLVLLALVCLAGAWYFTGGNFAALPRLLGFSHQLHSGAQLV